MSGYARKVDLLGSDGLFLSQVRNICACDGMERVYIIWDRFTGGMSTTNYDIPYRLSGLE